MADVFMLVFANSLLIVFVSLSSTKKSYSKAKYTNSTLNECVTSSFVLFGYTLRGRINHDERLTIC